MLNKLLTLMAVVGLMCSSPTPAHAADLQQTLRTAQSKIVKLYGAGGLKQMEAYQTGILISPEGHVLTVMSYVLDTDDLAVILDDGRKWQAEFLGSDPLTELALLKLPDEAAPVPFFDLRKAADNRAQPGDRIFALSNLYGIATGDEPVSVLQGVVTAVAPLRARRGAYQANYRGEIYVLDAYANNPGAAGGALVDWQGRLLGLLGKELRSEVTGTWLNYALPTANFAATVEDLLAGRSSSARAESTLPEEAYSAEALGISLIPDVLPRTPPYIDTIRRKSPAEQAGLRPDDLVVFVGGEPTDSLRTVIEQLEQQDRRESLTISVLRDGQLREFTLIANRQANPDDENPDEENSEDESEQP